MIMGKRYFTRFVAFMLIAALGIFAFTACRDREKEPAETTVPELPAQEQTNDHSDAPKEPTTPWESTDPLSSQEPESPIAEEPGSDATKPSDDHVEPTEPTIPTITPEPDEPESNDPEPTQNPPQGPDDPFNDPNVDQENGWLPG